MLVDNTRKATLSHNFTETIEVDKLLRLICENKPILLFKHLEVLRCLSFCHLSNLVSDCLARSSEQVLSCLLRLENVEDTIQSEENRRRVLQCSNCNFTHFIQNSENITNEVQLPSPLVGFWGFGVLGFW